MKEFKPTSWSIDNRTSIFIITIIITIAGLMSYQALPKEQFPDIVVPTIFVSTIYPGASPQDMEALVTKPLEKEIKAISGVKKLTSSSVQDFSSIIVEFNTTEDVKEAKQKVKDAVDKAKPKLPTDLLDDPEVAQLEFSETPIMFVNVSGNMDLAQIKDYADQIKDRIEELPEITRVDMVGALEKEIQVDIDKYKMTAAGLGFRDVENAIAFENMTISAGNVTMDGMTRSISVRGDFKDVEQIKNLVINSQSGARMYLKDVADVRYSHKERESYGRLNQKNVITLNVVKRGGENLISASDKIKGIIEEMEVNELPKQLEVITTGDMSRNTRVTLHDLMNTIIIGFILVTIILMFFMGATNAIFVAMSVPLSMAIAFMILPSIGFTLNMIVLFAFLLGLGIVVDDAIVVIENTHRIAHDEPELSIAEAAKKAAGEIFLPVLSGTATTLAPFFPLAFWQGIMGKFIYFLPITLIITLTASLVVAYIINPVFAVQFMKREHEEDKRRIGPFKRGMVITTALFVVVALIGYASKSPFTGNLAMTMLVLYYAYIYFLERAVQWFQKKAWPAVQNKYASFLTWALERPGTVMAGTILLLVVSFAVTLFRQPNVIFFPKADPNFIYTYLSMPIGTDVKVTDSLSRVLEDRVYSVIGKDNPLVESVITNVAIGASEDQFDRAGASHKAKVGVAFVEFAKRDGVNTSIYLDKIREAVKGIPGAEVTVDQEQGGPPTGKPVSVEIRGEEFEDLIKASTEVKRFLDAKGIAGIEELRSDLIVSKPEINIKLDRDRANREGLTTAQIGMEFRTAILGKEVSKLKEGDEEIPIVLRLKKDQRENINAVENLPITFRDMNMGGLLRTVPMAAFSDVKYTNTYGGIRRKNQDRMVTISSNVLTGYNPNNIVAEVTNALKDYKAPEGVTISMGGEQEEQEAAGKFLMGALLSSLCIILLILITQFNSIGKTLIILSEILFSIIGVLLGLAIFNMDFSIFMMGIGIVALAGIVVRNGILLVEFTDKMREEGRNVKDAIVEAGRIRMTPVLLTATATIMGLVPLAIGFNIDFYSLFATGDPKIFFGGDSVAFWGPLSWTIVFGLAFATFITLIILPVMYLLGWKVKGWFGRVMG
jgi:multidrug efflux pump